MIIQTLRVFIWYWNKKMQQKLKTKYEKKLIKQIKTVGHNMIYYNTRWRNEAGGNEICWRVSFTHSSINQSSGESAMTEKRRGIFNLTYVTPSYCKRTKFVSEVSIYF